jgi:hypothetical protein
VWCQVGLCGVRWGCVVSGGVVWYQVRCRGVGRRIQPNPYANYRPKWGQFPHGVYLARDLYVLGSTRAALGSLALALRNRAGSLEYTHTISKCLPIRTRSNKYYPRQPSQLTCLLCTFDQHGSSCRGLSSGAAAEVVCTGAAVGVVFTGAAAGAVCTGAWGSARKVARNPSSRRPDHQEVEGVRGGARTRSRLSELR